jgi:hypothetical protein
MRTFLHGATVMACLACALFFARFWRPARDRLFAFFSLAFVVLAINWCILTVAQNLGENQPLIYVLRLVAFGLIIYAIWDKNRGA